MEFICAILVLKYQHTGSFPVLGLAWIWSFRIKKGENSSSWRGAEFLPTQRNPRQKTSRARGCPEKQGEKRKNSPGTFQSLARFTLGCSGLTLRTQICSFFSCHAANVADNRVKVPENAALTLISNILEPWEDFLQLQLGELQNTGTYLGEKK